MLGKPQGAQDRGVPSAGAWRPGGRVPAVRVGAALAMPYTAAQLAGRRP